MVGEVEPREPQFMEHTKPDKRLNWEDRWSTPSLDQLLEPFQEDQRDLANSLIERIRLYDGVTECYKWYGTAWKWTVQFDVQDQKGKHLDTLTFLVPDPACPLVCIPLTEPALNQLPMRRLSKFIREGIRGAKRAVEVYWAYWQPSNQTEIDGLLDLAKRKHKILLAKVIGTPPA